MFQGQAEVAEQAYSALRFDVNPLPQKVAVNYFENATAHDHTLKDN